MGAHSRLFDPLCLVLLALLRFDLGDLKGLAAAQAQLNTHVQQLIKVPLRLQRQVQTVQALRAWATGDASAATRTLALVQQAHNDAFDLEAASLLVCLLVRLPGAAAEPAAVPAAVRTLALRFATSKASTELLVACAHRQPGVQACIRTCQAEIASISEQAVGLSLRGRAGEAAQTLIEKGQSTRNARLVELAQQLLRRHHAALGEAQHLSDRLSAMTQQFCQPLQSIAGMRREGRTPGGIAMRA